MSNKTARPTYSRAALVRRVAICPAPPGLVHAIAWADLDAGPGEPRTGLDIFPAVGLQSLVVSHYSRRGEHAGRACATHAEFLKAGWSFSHEETLTGVLYLDPDGGIVNSQDPHGFANGIGEDLLRGDDEAAFKAACDNLVRRAVAEQQRARTATPA